MKELEQFLQSAEEKAFDAKLRNTILSNISKYNKKVEEGKMQFSNPELAKTRAAARKQKAIDNLEKYLIEFEANFIKRGGKIIWAQDTNEATREILQIIKKTNSQTIVKSKSMATEEIELNESLERENISSIETDLGEYIVQLRKEKPFHIVTPAMHLTKEDVSKTMHDKKGTPENYSPEQITTFVRHQLRKEFVNTQIGVCGANFLIADTGSVSITENEGNAFMIGAFPKTQIVVSGVEKIIPSINDLELFWPLLASYGTGQQLAVYNSIYSGPKQTGETDGPEEMIIVLIDNGRSRLLEQPEQRKALTCIKCGACLNACPVYTTIGGHTYNTTYTGPIGSVITPFLNGKQDFKHLSFASTNCGKCTEVCPVNIDIHRQLMFNRKDFIDQGMASKSENWAWYFWKKSALSRSRMDRGGAKIKNIMLKQFFKKPWGDRRDFPQVAPKSFNQIWRERMGMK